MDRRQAQAQARREQAEQQWLRQHYDAHADADADAQLKAERDTAEREFRQAVLDSPIGQARLRARSAHWRRMALGVTTNNAATHLGARQVTEPRYTTPRLLEDIEPCSKTPPSRATTRRSSSSSIRAGRPATAPSRASPMNQTVPASNSPEPSLPGRAGDGLQGGERVPSASRSDLRRHRSQSGRSRWGGNPHAPH